MRTLLRSLLFLAVVSALAPAYAGAEGTTCGTATVVIADGRIQSSSIPAGTTFFYQLATKSGNSYSIEFFNPLGAAPQTPGTLSIFSDAACGTALTTTATTSNDPSMSLNGVRVAFTATSALTTFSVANASGAAIGYTFSASDTTMFSPSWSTNGTYRTYYSFFNTTSSAIQGTLTLTTTGGSPGGTTSLTINPGQTAATNTVALATPAGQTGTAKFTHNGPPAGILIEAAIANFSLSPPYIQPVKFQSVREIR